MRNDPSVVPVSKRTSGRCRRHDLSPSFLANFFVRQKLLWPRNVIVSSNVVESEDECEDEYASDFDSDAEDNDTWAKCDACQKWRVLPENYVVDENSSWTCDMVGRSCDERADDE